MCILIVKGIVHFCVTKRGAFFPTTASPTFLAWQRCLEHGFFVFSPASFWSVVAGKLTVTGLASTRRVFRDLASTAHFS